jgi:hypothetical protein
MNKEETIGDEEAVILERRDGTVYSIPLAELENFRVSDENASTLRRGDGWQTSVTGMSCRIKGGT